MTLISHKPCHWARNHPKRLQYHLYYFGSDFTSIFHGFCTEMVSLVSEDDKWVSLGVLWAHRWLFWSWKSLKVGETPWFACIFWENCTEVVTPVLVSVWAQYRLLYYGWCGARRSALCKELAAVRNEEGGNEPGLAWVEAVPGWPGNWHWPHCDHCALLIFMKMSVQEEEREFTKIDEKDQNFSFAIFIGCFFLMTHLRIIIYHHL